jgi:hypothetical protein
MYMFDLVLKLPQVLFENRPSFLPCTVLDLSQPILQLRRKQAGAELCQAQLKLDIVFLNF